MPWPRPIFVILWFYDEPNWEPTLCTKFEVDPFSHCINIKGKPQIFGSFPSLEPRPSFPLGGILWWALEIPTSLPILKSLSSVVAEILQGNSQIWKPSLAQGHAHFSHGCDLMMGLGKLKPHTKFEVASFSRCQNIKGNSKILGSFLNLEPRPLFSLGVILWWALANPSSTPNLKSLASAVAEILKGNRKILRSSSSLGLRPLFLWV